MDGTDRSQRLPLANRRRGHGDPFSALGAIQRLNQGRTPKCGIERRRLGARPATESSRFSTNERDFAAAFDRRTRRGTWQQRAVAQPAQRQQRRKTDEPNELFHRMTPR